MNSGDTIADFLRFATDDLREASEDPRRDAETLLCAVLECDRAWLFAYSDHFLDDTARYMFCHYVERRRAGEPVAYIIGRREFWSLMLAVNDSTLIPRHDTEILVETALQLCDVHNAHVLDLGAGTGAVALALAHDRPQWYVDAVDVHENAVELALLNAGQLGLSNVHVYRSDWFAAVAASTSARHARFDLIVSNPPYVAPDDPHLGQGDLRFEPHTALVAADDGYADLFHIAGQARDYLADRGLLLLEHGFEQGERVRKHLLSLGYEDVHTVRDYGDNERVTAGRWRASGEAAHG